MNSANSSPFHENAGKLSALSRGARDNYWQRVRETEAEAVAFVVNKVYSEAWFSLSRLLAFRCPTTVAATVFRRTVLLRIVVPFNFRPVVLHELAQNHANHLRGNARNTLSAYTVCPIQTFVDAAFSSRSDGHDPLRRGLLSGVHAV